MAVSKNYLKNPLFYDKSGRPRSGFHTERANYGIPKENFQDKDIGNRNAVVSIIDELVENGISLQEACKQVATKPEIIKNFKYFAKESLPQIFENWYNGKMRERKPIEKGER